MEMMASVSVQILRRFSTGVLRLSNKTGYGPNRMYRVGTHVVGTEPNYFKYHVLQDKKPTMEYGLQGTNHLNPIKGKICSRLPAKIRMKKDKIYAWCACGYSGSRCATGPTIVYIFPNLKLHPVRYIPDRDMEVWLCNCKQTKNRPFCDGSHKEIRDISEDEELFGK